MLESLALFHFLVPTQRGEEDITMNVMVGELEVNVKPKAKGNIRGNKTKK